MIRALLLVLACASAPAFAYTQPVFTGNAGMVLVRNPPLGESPDEDAVRLFLFMNVPPQDTMLGPGKNINTTDQIFNLVCGDRGKQGYLCNVIVRPSARSRVSLVERSFVFATNGEEARTLHGLFHPDVSGVVNYTSQDGSLHITSDGATLQVQYQAN